MAHTRRKSIVKMSRREGVALHPKAHKVLVKRTNKPGRDKSARENKMSQYGIQLREKQKAKRMYGLQEKQFVKLVNKSSRAKGLTGENLLSLLEQRMDNAVYRAGFAMSRQAARQLVTHGHFMLNDRRVDIPSIQLKPGDVITVRPKSTKNEYFTNLNDLVDEADASVSWVVGDRKNLKIEVKSLPVREDAEQDINEQLIIEFYSR